MKHWTQTHRWRFLRILAWTGALGSTAFLLFGCLAPGSSLPSVGIHGFDKWFHFIAFFVWAGAWLLAVDAAFRGALLVLFGGALFGGALEFAQAALPYKRSPELWDWLADVMGILVACALWWVLRRGALLEHLRPPVKAEEER